MNRLLNLAALALAILLAACTTVGPDYQRPASAAINNKAANGAFLGGSEDVFAREPVPGDWWRLYQSQQLDRLVQEALAANTDLRAAAANIERAMAGLDYADAARRPTTSVQASGAYARRSAEEELIPGGRQLPSKFVYGLGAGVSYQVDLVGQIARAIESAQADVGAARAAPTRRVTVQQKPPRLPECAGGTETPWRSARWRSGESTELTRQLLRRRGSTSTCLRPRRKSRCVPLPQLQAQNAARSTARPCSRGMPQGLHVTGLRQARDRSRIPIGDGEPAASGGPTSGAPSSSCNRPRPAWRCHGRPLPEDRAGASFALSAARTFSMPTPLPRSAPDHLGVPRRSRIDVSARPARTTARAGPLDGAVPRR